jgi:5-methylthioadenosine/S-adenosylhomocysteine deaminase
MALTVTGAKLDGHPVTVRAVDGTIAAIGTNVVAQPGDDIVDGSRCALVPGLVNGHTHAAMTLFRGFGGDLPLMEWLETKIWPAEAELTADDVYWGARLACLEMISTGTVKFWDMYWHPAALARAVEDAGMRAVVGLPLIDGLDITRAKVVQADVGRSLDELADLGPRVTASLTPHGMYTVSTDSLQWVAEQASARDLPVQLHFLEVEDEVRGLQERTGQRPAAYLDELGLLSPDTVLAHGVWMDDDDLDLVAERGATVVTNPASNLKLAVGAVFPYAKVRERGIPVGIGTDGASSNNSLDLLEDVKLLSLLQKHAQDDPTALPAEEAWAIVTGALAPRLGPSAQIAVGAPADFLLVRLDVPTMVPGDLIANLVYSASGAVVDATVVAGRALMRGGVIEGADEVLAKATEVARRLQAV